MSKKSVWVRQIGLSSWFNINPFSFKICTVLEDEQAVPLLNNLVVTVSQVSPIYRHLQQIFQDVDIQYEVLPGFDEVEDDTTEGVLAVKFIMGRDLAVTRSSPDSC